MPLMLYFVPWVQEQKDQQEHSMCKSAFFQVLSTWQHCLFISKSCTLSKTHVVEDRVHVKDQLCMSTSHVLATRKGIML